MIASNLFDPDEEEMKDIRGGDGERESKKHKMRKRVTGGK